MAMTTSAVHGFQVTRTPSDGTLFAATTTTTTTSRRSFFINSLIVVTGILGGGTQENAAEASTRGYQISSKLKAQEARTRENAPRQALPSGVAFQEFLTGRSGFGECVCKLYTMY